MKTKMLQQMATMGLATWISKKAIDRVVAKHVGEDMGSNVSGAGIPTDGLDIAGHPRSG